MEVKIPTEREKPNRKSNVHFWLRKVFYFVEGIPDDTVVNVVDTIALKGETEQELRRRLKKEGDLEYEIEKITKQEALKACQKLFCMFMEPFEPKVQKFIEDPLCPGGRPRGSYGG